MLPVLAHSDYPSPPTFLLPTVLVRFYMDSGSERAQYLHRCISPGTKLLRAPATPFKCSSQGNLSCSTCTHGLAQSGVKVPVEERNGMRPQATCRHTVYWQGHRFSMAGTWCWQGGSMPRPAAGPCCSRTTEEETSGCWPAEG